MGYAHFRNPHKTRYGWESKWTYQREYTVEIYGERWKNHIEVEDTTLCHVVPMSKSQHMQWKGKENSWAQQPKNVIAVGFNPICHPNLHAFPCHPSIWQSLAPRIFGVLPVFTPPPKDFVHPGSQGRWLLESCFHHGLLFQFFLSKDIALDTCGLDFIFLCFWAKTITHTHMLLFIFTTRSRNMSWELSFIQLVWWDTRDCEHAGKKTHAFLLLHINHHHQIMVPRDAPGALRISIPG